jgi:shikimate kinase
MSHIFLFGFKKCGKTYFGMKAAQNLHREFLESHHLVEELYSAEYHEVLPYREIVKKHGFPFFQELEKQVVSLLLQKRGEVVSLGGGIVLEPENVMRLQEVGTFIYLKVPKLVLKARILSGDVPSYFDPKHPEHSFETMYKEREPVYERVASHTIDVEKNSEEEVLKKIYQYASGKSPP